MRALLIVDVQNDFCPGGTLAVKDGHEVVPVINSIIDQFDLVIASKDWHPLETIHFKKWPVHCVADTSGAAFHKDLKERRIQKVLLKGTGNKDDGYSAFEATNEDLGRFLKTKGVTDLYVTGLATDYCVKATAMDSARLGYNTYVISDAIRAVELQKGDSQEAMEDMTSAGISIIESIDV